MVPTRIEKKDILLEFRRGTCLWQEEEIKEDFLEEKPAALET